MSVWPEAGHLQLAGEGPEPRAAPLLREGDGSPRDAPSSGDAPRDRWSISKGWAVRGTSRSSLPSGRGAIRRRACFRALFAGAFGCRRTRPPVTLEHRCQPFGAERWVATDSSESGRDEAGDRAPSGETDRLRGASLGISPGVRTGSFGIRPGAAEVDLRDDRRQATDPGLPFGATGRTGCVAVFGLPASRTGGPPSFGMAPASALSEPDKPRSCLPRHSRVVADAATAWNRLGGTTGPDGRVGASCAADI